MAQGILYRTIDLARRCLSHADAHRCSYKRRAVDICMKVSNYHYSENEAYLPFSLSKQDQMGAKWADDLHNCGQGEVVIDQGQGFEQHHVRWRIFKDP